MISLLAGPSSPGQSRPALSPGQPSSCPASLEEMSSVSQVRANSYFYSDGDLLFYNQGLLAAGVMDLSTKSYPPWFRGLRFLLTFFAVFSLVATSVFSYSLGSKKQPSDYLT